MIGLTFDAIAGIINDLKDESYEEPLSDLHECNLVKLESSLKAPFLRPDLDNEFDTFCDKAATFFYLMTENHCFGNGNKRIAVTSLVTLAQANGYKINMTPVSLYALSIGVTLLTKYKLVDEAKDEIVQALQNSLVKKSGRPISNETMKALEQEFEVFMMTNYE